MNSLRCDKATAKKPIKNGEKFSSSLSLTVCC